MSIVKRTIKGSPLTWTELDGNFEHLESTKVSKALLAGGSRVLVQITEEDEPEGLEIPAGHTLANLGDGPEAVPFETVAPKGIVVEDRAGVTVNIAMSDNGKYLRLSNATEIACNLPVDATVGLRFHAEQTGNGRISFLVAEGGQINGRSGWTKSSSQYGVVRVVCVGNVDGESAKYVLSGDLAAS